jgi:phosphatidylserine decarboxylase
LGGLELLKREIFDKFSLQQIKYKSFTNPDVLPLMIVSFLIVSISFYSSIKGAEEFSTKTKEIQTQVETNIKSYQDSLNSIKNIELSKINTKIESKESKIEEKDKELTELSNVDDLSKQQKIRIKDLKSQAQLLTQEINVLKSEKDTIEKRTQREILNHKANVESKGIEKKEENSDNSFFFVVIYSNFNSYHKFNSILNIIYSDDTKINDKLMSSKSILELCKVNGINVLQKDINNMFKLFSSLGIISKGSNKYYLKSKSIAQEVLKKHFNID